jgi:hypothetical protein
MAGPSTAEAKARKRARTLKAVDARALLHANLPYVLKHMTDAEVDQIQRVLDAAVVDPEIKREADDIYRRSVISQSGPLVYRDQSMVHRSDRVLEGYIFVKDEDKHLRLDYQHLLTPDALKPTTDNPDEATFLQGVPKTLASKGVWLRLGQPYVHPANDPPARILDKRVFEVWLSLGYDGDTIPTEDGRLTREALLGTTHIGGSYYERVIKGAMQSALDREVKHLYSQIEDGVEQYNEYAKIRRQAAPGVAWAADKLGGADFPDQSLWDQARKFVHKARELNLGENITGSQALLVAAAITTRAAAQVLADYIEATYSGVEQAVKILKVVKTAGKIAEVGLALTGVVGIVRGGAAASASAAGGGDVDAAAERLLNQYLAKNPELTEDLANVRYVRQPAVKAPKRVKPYTP